MVTIFAQGAGTAGSQEEYAAAVWNNDQQLPNICMDMSFLHVRACSNSASLIRVLASVRLTSAARWINVNAAMAYEEYQ